MHPDTPPDESNVLEKVETALKQAVRQHPDLSWEYGTRIKRQKYVYIAVKHFTQSDDELPVTYSWYKFGAVLPASPQTGTIGPVSTQMPTPDARESGIFSTPFDKLVKFFEEGLSSPELNEEHWYASDLDFLMSFYENYVPTEYQDLYLGNIELRRKLSETIETLKRQCDGTKSQVPTTGIVLSEDDYKTVGQAAARMHLGVVGVEYLGETLSEVRRFTNLVEDAFLTLSRSDHSEVTDTQLAAIEKLEENYNEWVWEYPALLISRETATGPNASTLRKWSAQKHFSVEDNLQREINDAARICREAGLVPSSNQYPKRGDEIEESVKKIALSTMRRDD